MASCVLHIQHLTSEISTFLSLNVKLITFDSQPVILSAESQSDFSLLHLSPINRANLEMEAIASVSAASLVAASTALALPSPAPASSSSPSVFWLFVSAIYSTIYYFHRISFSLITFTTYTLPTWLFTLFSTSLTVTMNFTTL